MSKYSHKYVDMDKNVTFFAFSDERKNPLSGKGSVSTGNYHGVAPLSGAQANDIPRLNYSAMKEEEKPEESKKPEVKKTEDKKKKKASVADFIRHLAAMPAVAPAEKEEPSAVEEGKEGAKFIHVYVPKDKSRAEFILSDSKSEKPVKKTLNLTSIERPGRMIGGVVAYIKKNLGKLLEGTDVPIEDLDTLTLFEDKQTGIPVIVYAKGKVTSDVVGRGGWVKSVASPVLTQRVEKGVGESGGINVKKLSAAETVRELMVALANAEQGV